MGPVLLKKKAKDGTIYAIRAIPIGGFVSLAGEEVEVDLTKQKGHNLQDKTVFQRFLVMFMGVGFNFIFAFLVLFISALIFGSQDMKPVITNVTTNSPAHNVGVMAGDKIVSINDHNVTFYDDISLYLTLSDLSKPIEMEVERNDKVYSYEITPIKEEKDGEVRYLIGIELVPEKESGFFASIKYAFLKEAALFKQMFVTIGNLFTGGISVKQLSGPVGIYSIVGEVRQLGTDALLYLIALLSINVGIINILPFPAFDGGRILFLIIEKIKGSPVSPKVENLIHSIGFILLIILMLYITFNDILRLF